MWRVQWRFSHEMTKLRHRISNDVFRILIQETKKLWTSKTKLHKKMASPWSEQNRVPIPILIQGHCQDWLSTYVYMSEFMNKSYYPSAEYAYDHIISSFTLNIFYYCHDFIWTPTSENPQHDFNPASAPLWLQAILRKIFVKASKC